MKVHEFQHEMAQTSGIFGRNKEAYVTFSGDRAYTDGTRVNLPALPSDLELSPTEVAALRGYVDHEAGHLRHSNMPLTIDTYKKWIDSGYSGLKDIHNALEDIWLEQRVMRDYPGSAKNLRATTSSVNKKTLEHLKGAPPDVLDNFEVPNACLGITTVGREDYGAEQIDELIDKQSPRMVEHAKKWTQLAREAENTEEVMEIAKAVHKLLREDPELASDPEDFDPNSGEGEGEGDGSDAAPGSPDYRSGEKDGDGDSVGKAMESALGDMVKDIIAGGDGIRDGEYGDPHRVYTTEYDYYATKKDPHDEEVFKIDGTAHYEESKTSIRDTVLVMKSKLKRALLSRERRDWDFAREQGKLDSKRLTQAYSGSRSVYKARIDREEEDTAVLFLVDLSGSMRGEKIHKAEEAVVALTESLEGTRIRYSVIGFSDQWPNNVKKPRNGFDYHRCMQLRMVEFKSFDDNLRASRSAIGNIHLSSGFHNSDPCAIRKSLNILRARPESRKVLITLSDGSPCTETKYGGEELIRHCKSAIAWGNKKGIQSVGIGILDKSVESIYDSSIVIKNVKDLASGSFKKLTDVLLEGRI